MCPAYTFNRNLGYYGYDLTRLTDYEFWFSLPESGFPNFYYACDMWQYSFTETVPRHRRADGHEPVVHSKAQSVSLS